MKKCVIRPFNVTSMFFLLIILLFIIPIPLLVAGIISGSEKLGNVLIVAPFYLLIFGWLSTLLLSIVFRPKIILFDDHLEIIHWKNGVPYDKNHPISLPKTTKTIIEYSSLSLFGGYFIKDVTEYIKKNSGYLADKWIIVAGQHIPIPIKLPAIATKLRDVLLFVKSDGESFVVDGGQYGYRQVQLLLHELEMRTQIRAEGRVKPKEHINSFFLNAISALGVICWFFVVPISTIWLEGILNSAHIPAYQSVWKTVYVFSILFANLGLTGYVTSRKFINDAESKLVGKVFGIMSLVLYPIFIASFVLSVLS